MDKNFMDPDRHLTGISGWLILVAIGIIISPIRILVMTVPIYYQLFSTGVVQVLTTPGNEAYHPLWLPIIAGEVVINGALVVWWIVLAVLFFTKKRLFPKMYIAALSFTLVFIVGDAFAAKIVLPDDPVFDPDTLKTFLQSLLGACIWIPYMLVSKRVQLTFVN